MFKLIICSLLLLTSLGFPKVTSAGNTVINTAECSFGTFFTPYKYSVELVRCDNLWEGTFWVVAPDGTTTEILPWQDFLDEFNGWKKWMPEPTILPVTVSGEYSFRGEGIGCIAFDWVNGVFTCINGTVYYQRNWYMESWVEGRPRKLEKPTRPEVGELNGSEVVVSWIGEPGEYRVIAKKMKGKKVTKIKTTCTITVDETGPGSCVLQDVIPGRWRIRVTITSEGQSASRTKIVKFYDIQ